ncbi:MAG: 2-oxoglutarate dehydrogenase E1 subunit family protein, partial [Pirellulales bacterium]
MTLIDTPVDGMDLAGTASLAFIEELFAAWQADPASVPADWQAYFQAMAWQAPVAGAAGAAASNGHGGAVAAREHGGLVTPDGIATARAVAIAHGDVQLADAPAGEAMPLPLPPVATGTPGEERVAFLQDRVDQLVRAYRVRGHLMAEIDPLGRPRPGLPELDPRFYHLTDDDLDRVFSTDTIEGPQSMTLRQIIKRLRNTYCRSIGVQFMHMDDLRVRQWLQVRMEGCENRIQLDRHQQLRIYRQMTTAAVFEEFIQKRFLGAKSFSLEGSETLVPLLEMAIERAAVHEIDDVVMAMAHRGRLNVLANIMGKSPQRIF